MIGTAATGGLLLFLLPLFEVGFIGDLALSTFFGAGIAGYLALRKDEVGSQARTLVGSNAMMAADKAKTLESEYKVVDTVKAKADELIKTVKDQIG